MFLGLLDPDPLVRGMDLSSCKNSKTNLDSYCFVTLFDFLSLKNDVNVPTKSNKQKNFLKKLFFVGILKENDENSRIRIRTHCSETWIRGSRSGSTPKCHGSATLLLRRKYFALLSTSLIILWVYLVGLLDVAHLKVEAAGGGQQGRLPLLHLHTLQQAQALDTHKLQHK
jgi:hypothetical protein